VKKINGQSGKNVTLYLELKKGRWRVRKPIPKELQAIIGRGAFLTESLQTSDKRAANELAHPVIAKFNAIIDAARKGESPPIPDWQKHQIATQWLAIVDSEIIGENEIRYSNDGLENYLATLRPQITPANTNYAPIRELCIEKINRQRATIDFAEHAYTQAGAIFTLGAGSQSTIGLATASVGKFQIPVTRDVVTFQSLMDMWASDRGVQENTKAKFGWDFGRLIKFLGHEDASRVEKPDMVKWKFSLQESGLRVQTVKNYFNAVNTIFNWAVDNDQLPMNPAKGVKVSGKDDPMKKRQTFTLEQAGLLLAEARHHPESVIKWANWCGALMGCRLEEICSAHCRDIVQIEDRWYLHIRLDHRHEGATLKNATSTRIIPISKILEKEGFLDYWRSQRQDGALFPDLHISPSGKKSTKASLLIGEWIRPIVPDKRLVWYSWRHLFVSIARAAGIPKDLRKVLMGHAGDDVHDQYGETFYTALSDAINKLSIPVPTRQEYPINRFPNRHGTGWTHRFTTRAILTPEGRFETVTAAAKANGISKPTASRRANLERQGWRFELPVEASTEGTTAPEAITELSSPG